MRRIDTIRTTLTLAMLLALGACGVKSDVQPPAGAQTHKGEIDPAKPPQPLGQ